MAKLISPQITVTFTELGISAIGRGNKGTVAIIIREAAGQGSNPEDTPVEQNEQVSNPEQGTNSESTPKPLSPVVLTQATQTPTDFGKANQEYIKRAFIGYVNPPKKVIVYPLAEGSKLADALTWMESQDFDYIVGPEDCTYTEAKEIESWIKSQRTNRCVKYKAVLPNRNADNPAIVNFTTKKLYEGDVVYTNAAFCSRIAGLLAGTPMKISATYAPLPELTDVSRLSKEEQNTAVSNGELIAIWDGRKAKLSRAVNSFVTISEGMLDSFKKIKIMEIMDLIRTDIYTTAEDEYIGKYANNYDNKMLLVAALRGYFEGLRQDSLIQSGYTVDINVEAQEQYLMSKGTDTSDMGEQEIKEANTGSHVFLKISCKILDAIEDIDIDINI